VIVPADLLAGLQRLLKRLEPDIRSRCETDREIDARLRVEYEKARSASRTAQVYEVWREDYITQVAVAWILGCVFVRFLEDNRLIDIVWLAGANGRVQLARDQHTLYFQSNPTHSDREYLKHVFEEIAKLPSMRELLNGSHNPISKLGPTGDGAHELLEFWQKVDPSTGAIIHDFTDPEWSTRFLGDLYQDLSESARERYALLQTPEFVEEFILDRTLSPAIQEFGYSTVKMIDPACGSGHFLLGGFRRLLDLRLRHEAGIAARAQVEAALSQVFGIDVNPFAAAIARFRLLIAALKASSVQTLSSAPGFQINIAAGDSLLHGPSPRGQVGVQRSLEDDPLQHYYEIEDKEAVRRFLTERYHVVVGNPPYITVKDPALNAAYRNRYASCYGTYQLAVPFIERFFDLCARGGSSSAAGFVGILTSKAFGWKEFGKKIVEQLFPRWDLTHVVDTSGAGLAGHSTPTLLLFARNRLPNSETVRAVRGLRNEAGATWQAICDQIDRPGSDSEYISVADVQRVAFYVQPWPMGGGGASDLKDEIEHFSPNRLKDYITDIGRTTHTGEDEAFYMPCSAIATHGFSEYSVPLAIGETIRDWVINSDLGTIFPYDPHSGEPRPLTAGAVEQHFWKLRTSLSARRDFGKSLAERGLRWFDHSMFFKDRYKNKRGIAFAFKATHNHFAYVSTPSVFKQTAPVIQLDVSATEDLYFGLLALLNSSVACFWGRQTYFQTGGYGDGRWQERLEWDSTKLRQFPIPSEMPSDSGRTIHISATSWLSHTPKSALVDPHRVDLVDAQRTAEIARRRMIAEQEELDWRCYRLYGLIDEDLCMPDGSAPPILTGERAFEIRMARKIASGEIATSWFEQHRSQPITDLPEHWPEAYRKMVQRRLDVTEANKKICLIEQPECKRRWQPFDWNEQKDGALRKWLRTRLEGSSHWAKPELLSCASLADQMRIDQSFLNVAEIFRGRPDFELADLIRELVEPEAVPFLPVLRYKDSGMRDREVWERTWDLQRREDAIDAEIQLNDEILFTKKAEAAKKRKAELGDFPVPPKYDSKDFQKPSYWSLRGKLDVPTERFISFPFCGRDVDQTPVIGWAGWDHLQQAQAIAAYYERVKNQEGWTPERRVPLLTGILELIPWLKQWHNDIHPEYKERMGEFFQQFVTDEARSMELTIDQIRGWTPPVQARTSVRKKRNT